MKYKSAQELYFDMDEDFDKYPLPICFDEIREQYLLGSRRIRLEEIAERWFRIYGNKINNTGQPVTV